MAAEVPRHAARQAMDGGLRRRVDGKAAGRAPPGVRSKVDDRAAAGVDHPGRDGLDREEHVAQVGVMRSSKYSGRNVGPGVTVVARGVVDEHLRRSLRGRERLERRLQRADVAQVAGLEAHMLAIGAQHRGQRRSALLIEIDEPDLRLPAPRMREPSPRRCRTRRR